MTEDLDYSSEYADPVAARLAAITGAAMEVATVKDERARDILLDAMASAAASIKPKTTPASVTRLGKAVSP